MILLLRYAGMHVSILAHPDKYNLQVVDDEIVWDRPKKHGKTAYTSILTSKNIDIFNELFITCFNEIY